MAYIFPPLLKIRDKSTATLFNFNTLTKSYTKPHQHQIPTITFKMPEKCKLCNGSGFQGPYKCGLCGGPPPQETPKPDKQTPTQEKPGE